MKIAIGGRPGRSAGFSLVEMMVAVAVLAILLALVAQLFNGATKATSISTTHLEADERTRLLFARMAADFSRIVTRADVDAYLKTDAVPQTGGNDQIAFYSEVEGYASSSDAQSTVALVAYRVNSGTSAADKVPYVERMGKALGWSASSGIQAVAFLPLTIAATWPAATTSATDADYEELAPDTFRLEIYYLLRSGLLSTAPWDGAAGHSTLSGFQDVAAIGVAVAVADRKAVAAAPVGTFAMAAAKLGDFKSGMTVGQLEKQWQQALATAGLTPAVQAGIHVYGRLFPVGPVLRP